MKNAGSLAAILYICFLYGCGQAADHPALIVQIENELNAGNLEKVKLLTDSIAKRYPGERRLIHKADSISQIAERIALDFSVTEESFTRQLRDGIGDFSAVDRALWEKETWIEWRMINGEKRYFNRAASNLNLLRSFHLQKDLRDSAEARDPEIVFRKKHTASVIRGSDMTIPVVPVEMTINYTLTVEPDAVPAGEKVRCWLPYPKESHSRQQKIRFISASDENYTIAPDSAVHRTIYIEGTAEKGKPLTFSVSFSYKSSGQYFNPDQFALLPYDKNSQLYREYTSEQPPHICFTGRIKNLADSIAPGKENPFETVRKIYLWFSANIPWAGAQEYSIIPNIPEYTASNRRGDCGMQTFLFISMLRYKGIPVRWQSGWKVPPGGKNLHDWCEIYYEGVGWVPADISYGLQYSEDRRIREFYISGIDSYRLIINDGVAGVLYPEKTFLRSEPFDFQRGEVEWRGGNLYFDTWDYGMDIEYKD